TISDRDWSSDVCSSDLRRKYYFNAGARRDGSSRLSADQRWANFGQVGASWIMSEEKFMQGSRNWLNSLKLKASYGSVGSQGIGEIGRASCRERGERRGG